MRVENQSAFQITEIRLELGKKMFWTGSLAPGQSHRAFGTVSRDGYITIEFHKDAVAHRRIFSYVTTLFPDHHTLTITPELEIQCSSVVADCTDLAKRPSLSR